MTTRILSLTAALTTAFGVAACSTVQENPNYQYSSKYGLPDTTVQVADANPGVQTQSTTYTPEAQRDVTSATDRPSGLAGSPTDEAYNADAMMGTPGYQLYLQEQAAATPVGRATGHSADMTPSAPNGARAVPYDYSDNYVGIDDRNQGLTYADTPVAEDSYGRQTYDYGDLDRPYIVRQGDTVYSLSRRLCISVSDMAEANDIGSDYAIKIGQTITLPPSRC